MGSSPGKPGAAGCWGCEVRAGRPPGRSLGLSGAGGRATRRGYRSPAPPEGNQSGQLAKRIFYKVYLYIILRSHELCLQQKYLGS